MLQKIREYILNEGLISPNETVLTGFSGGADSLCLLKALWELRDLIGIRVIACHVHHMLRETADRDAEFCRDFCEREGIPLLLKKVDVRPFAEEHRLSVEEAARLLRHEALRTAAAETGAVKIALAHHADDQAETVLFQMIRGSGLRGLSGMQPLRDEFIRPLLPFTKAEIFDFLRENGLSHVEDETNALLDASRNRLRHKVLPALSEIRPDAAVKIAETAAYISEADSFIRGEAAAWIGKHVSGGEIPAEEFIALHPVLKEYIVAEMLRRAGIPMKDVGRKHIDGIVGLSEKEVGKTVMLPAGNEAVRTYTGIFPRKGEKNGETVRESVKNGGFTGENSEKIHLSVRVFRAEKDRNFPESAYTKWFSYDKIKMPVVLRHRENGDVFSTVAGTHKKLKDVLIDEKIPREERDRLFVVAAGKEVLWIVGLRMSEAYKIDETTEEIMEMNISGGTEYDG